MKLEQYIKENRDRFDEDISETVWEELSPKLERRKSYNFKYFKLAASILFFVGIGYWLGILKNHKPEVAEYAELSSYKKTVEKKRAELQILTVNKPELEEVFGRDLEDLQKDFENLKIKLENNPNQQLIIKAMIENLEWQIELLNQQTKIAEKSDYKSI